MRAGTLLLSWFLVGRGVLTGCAAPADGAPGPTPSAEISSSLVGPSTARLRSDGTILFNGTPFFPIGFYEARRSDLATLSAAGFNVAHINRSTSEDYGTMLDEAARVNVTIIGACPSEDVVGCGLVSAYSTRPAILGWDAEDDADSEAYRTFDQVTQKARSIKANDPDHLTYLSVTAWNSTRRNRASAWTSITDTTGVQMYPIPAPSAYQIENSAALTETYARMRRYVDAARASGTTAIANTQAFSWGPQQPNSRYPTPAEERNMTYTALAAGVKGIVYYSYRGITAQTALWNELQAIATEVKTLTPALVDGALVRVDTGDQEVVASSWQLPDAAYIVVANTSYSSTKTVSIPVPPGITATRALFGNRPSGLVLSGSRLVGQLRPTDVHVYVSDAAPGADGAVARDAAAAARDANPSDAPPGDSGPRDAAVVRDGSPVRPSPPSGPPDARNPISRPDAADGPGPDVGRIDGRRAESDGGCACSIGSVTESRPALAAWLALLALAARRRSRCG